MGWDLQPPQETGCSSSSIPGYREQVWIHQASESVLDELNNCPPAPGYERVEIPGERERDFRKESQGEILIRERTWEQIQDLACRVGAL